MKQLSVFALALVLATGGGMPKCPAAAVRVVADPGERQVQVRVVQQATKGISTGSPTDTERRRNMCRTGVCKMDVRSA